MLSLLRLTPCSLLNTDNQIDASSHIADLSGIVSSAFVRGAYNHKSLCGCANLQPTRIGATGVF